MGDFGPILVAAVRFAAAALMLATAMIAGVGLVRGSYGVPVSPEIRQVRWLGVLLLSMGWSVHQLWWWLWQMAIVSNVDPVKGALERGSYVAMIPIYVAILTGSAMLVAGYSSHRWGQRWPILSAGLIGTLVLIGTLAAMGARP